ncbi:MAG: hypothetical protein ABI402_21020 [Ferruginibacter sp.]
MGLSYDIIKAHGGKIKLESNEGVGKCVYYSIASCLNHGFERIKRLHGLGKLSVN